MFIHTYSTLWLPSLINLSYGNFYLFSELKVLKKLLQNIHTVSELPRAICCICSIKSFCVSVDIS